MAVNKYRDHVLVVPEDDANRQLANGFVLDPSIVGNRIDIRPVAGGWAAVRDAFKDVHLAGLRKYPARHLVLLIDFDDQVELRARTFRDEIPAEVASRVYLLGARSEPERLRASLGKSLEEIGKALARACVDGDDSPWTHDLLRHNNDERTRLTTGVKPFLFSARVA